MVEITDIEDGQVKLLAEALHEKYEEFASETGWQTQDGCTVPFDQLDQKNKDTMLMLAGFILEEIARGSDLFDPEVIQHADE